MSVTRKIFFISAALVFCFALFAPGAGAALKKNATPEYISDEPAVEDLRPDTPRTTGAQRGTAPEDLSPDAPKKSPEDYSSDTAQPPLAGTKGTSTPSGKKPTKKKSAASSDSGYILEPEDMAPDTAPPPDADKLKKTSKIKPMAGEEPVVPSGGETSEAATGSLAVESATATGAATASITETPPAATSSATTTSAATATARQPAATGTLPTPVEEKPPSPRLGPIIVSGFTELASQNISSSGNAYNFEINNGLLYHEKFTQRMHLFFNGDLNNGTKLEGEFVEMPFMDRVIRLNAEGPRYHARVGDTSVKFESGPMTAFSKDVRGLDFGYHVGGTSMGLLFSKQKSKSQRETFQGRNMRGPYVLRATGIVKNTEVVRINGQVMPRSRYYMDYFLGQVTFIDTIDSSDTVDVDFESEVWLDLNTGNLFGVSLAHAFKNGKMSAGASFLRETSKHFPDAKVFSQITSKQKGELFDAVAGQYIFRTGYSHLEKNYELVSTAATGTIYFTRDTDYAMNYASGVITFASASATFANVPDTSTITIVFNYYDANFLQWVQNEMLEGEGALEYSLSHERIYSGTEYVSVYENNVFIRQLDPGANKDYEINESKNSIIFNASVAPSAAVSRYARISYEIVPEADRVTAEQRAERTVESFFGNASFGKLTLAGEIAQTQSDVRLKTVQVTEELVGTVANAQQTSFPLQHEAIFNSVEIFLDDTISPSSRRISGSDYVLEPGTGPGRETVIQFKTGIPLGATIIANYTYHPDLEYLKERKGLAGRLTADYNTANTAFNAEYMRKSPYFAPMTSYNDLEADRLLANLDLKNLNKFNLSFNFAQQKYNSNFSSPDKITFQRLRTRLGYRFGKDNEAGVALENFSRRDNRPVSRTDNDLAGRSFDLKYRVTDSLTTSMLYEASGLSDNTGNTSARDVRRGDVGLVYTPAPNIKVDLSLGNSKLRSTPPEMTHTGAFVISTFSSRLNTMYLPNELVTFNINLDTQSINDTREGTSNSKVDSIRADFQGRGDPDSRLKAFKNYGLSFFRQDRPDPVFGDSRTEVASARAAFQAGASLEIGPSYTAAKSRIADAFSQDNTAGLRVDYRPSAKNGWRGGAAYTAGSRKSQSGAAATSAAATSAAASSSSRENQLSFNFDFIPNEKITWSGVYQTSQTSSGDTKQTRNSYTAKLLYLLNRKSHLRLAYYLDDAGGASDRNSLEFGATSSLDKNMDLDLEYKKQEQQGAGSSDYSGTLLTMKLLINF